MVGLARRRQALIVELHPFTFAGILALAMMVFPLLAGIAIIYLSCERRYDAARDRDAVKVAHLAGRIRDMNDDLRELAQEIAELRGMLNVRTAKRGG